MNRDLTQGRPSSVLWRFCLPLFASVLFQQLYNIADSLVAGKWIGENALAAVGNSYEITLIFIAFAFGCNMGCSVVVSRLFGAKEYGHLLTAVSTAFLMTGTVVLLLMVPGLLLSDYLLGLLRTPEILLKDSAAYLNIYILGLPFMFFYNVSTGIFSALGDSKTPFLFLAVSSTANIFVDILFVSAFRMGVPGVAWATFLCQGISCVLSVFFVIRRLLRLPGRGSFSIFSARLLRQILSIAVPSTLQQSFISVGNLIIQAVINGFGPGVIAGYAAAIKLNNLVITSLTTLGNGISNYTAQNLGAGRRDRIQEGFLAGLRMVAVICIPFFILYFFFGEVFMRFFLDQPTEDALSTGILFLRIVAPFYFVVAAKLVSDGILRGAGLMTPFMIATFTDLILRIVFSILFSRIWGSVGIWCSWPIGWVLGMALSLVFYLRSFALPKQFIS